MARVESNKQRLVRMGLSALITFAGVLTTIAVADSARVASFSANDQIYPGVEFLLPDQNAIQLSPFGLFLRLRKACPENLHKARQCLVQYETSRVLSFRKDGLGTYFQNVSFPGEKIVTAW